ncbi:MAG: TIGR02391 family protein [Dehalococcoidia bacterium]|nr:TIGR02391 family protein [Dehalococcoidia bacterium]
MDKAEKQKIIDELKAFYKKLRSYQNRQRKRFKEAYSDAKDRSLNALRLELQRYHARLKDIISQYGGEAGPPFSGRGYMVFSLALGSLYMDEARFMALDEAISLVNKAIAAFESAPLANTESQKVSLTQELEDTCELPGYLFDKMQFHPRVIEVSESLFKTGNYAPAIFEAFKAVENLVKEKTALSLNGQALMSKVFDEKAPIIRLNDLLTESDRDEQEGFKFLFKGATIGIRNPKAHDNVVQTDPYRTIEYLGLASLLMKRIQEGKIVKLS